MGEKASGSEDGVDRISVLPDPILHLILSRVTTTEEVVRTSILSLRWRNLWTSVPSIDIDFSRRLKSSKELGWEKFEEFVGCVLANRSLNLESLRLCCSGYGNMSTIRQWIYAAVTRNVKLLDLILCPFQEYGHFELPHCLLNCGSLEVLRLCLFGRWLRLHNNITGFPSLRVLELNNVKLYWDKLVEGFFKSCPLLEDLSLKDCLLNELDTLCITCPKLKNLYIDNLAGISGIDFEEVDNYRHGPSKILVFCPKLVVLELRGCITCHDLIFESPDSLKKVVIYCEKVTGRYFGDNIMPEWFVGLSRVESLSIGLQFIILCSFGVSYLSRRGCESLPNLKTLELTIGWYSMDLRTTDKLIKILLCCPNLESLHLIFQGSEYTSWLYKRRYCYWELKVDETEEKRILTEQNRILTRHLKRVEFLEFSGRSQELFVVRSLLEHGNELEEMVFSWDDEAKFHKRSKETMNQVSKFHKASSTVKLVTLLEK